MNIKPIQASNRIVYLDILRGMAIFFIFIANCYPFSGWYYVPDEVKNTMSGAQLNTILKQLTVVLVDGKWYSVFSILFGIGFVIQYENTKAKNESFPIFFSKRMAGLLLFGLIHLFFLWLGDILTLYALLGFVLILFRNLSQKQLLIWACVLLLMPIIHVLVIVSLEFYYPELLFDWYLSYLADNNIQDHLVDGEYNLVADITAWLDGTSWKQLFIYNLGLPSVRLMDLLWEGRIIKVLACFLIGIWAGRKILHDELLQNKTLLKKIAIYGFLLGIPMNILLAYSKIQINEAWAIINYTSYAFGVVPLACAYAASVALIVRSGKTSLSLLAPVGQMAMSNYIFQTIISIGLYYGIGFGLALETTLWQVILLTVSIFILQIFFSTYWLRKFRFGPLEWLWRMMTYQKYIKNRK
ncbi:uncharacterized protein SAMN06298216_2837 [Spirosomataceae bacterium TFI 002]|nr:uncharacterized protein SAMN06298216_2837 [Spirosomataceae bacterium TFI 002]